MYQLLHDRPYLVLGMIIANVILSVWCMSLDSVINFDGVTYLSVAQLFLDGEFTRAFEYFSWPFYSLFIAMVSKLFMLDLEMAAYVLNAIFATSLTLAFVCIVGELSNNNRRIVLIAAVIVLLFPSITKYRAFIIRDFGYLSCYLWSLYFIFRFCATAEKKHLISWLVFAALSSLFRFEGIVFILIAPYFLFLFGAHAVPHRKKLLAMASALIAGASVALLFWYVNDKYQSSVEVARQTGQNINGLTDLFIANIQSRLGDEAVTTVGFLRLLLDTTGDVAYELIRRMAIFYFIFALYAYYKQLTLTEKLPRRIWQVFFVVNLLMLVTFGMGNNFLVSRYTMASALTLLILAPFTIDLLINYMGRAGALSKIGVWFIFFILAVVSLERLDVRTSKQYIKQSGQWVKQNLPADAKIYSNNKLAIYYADKGVESNLDHLYSLHIMTAFLKSKQIRHFDYVVLIGSPDDKSQDVMRQTLAYHFGLPIHQIVEDNRRFAMIFDTKARLKQRLKMSDAQ